MAFFEHWKNWQKCLALAQNPLEREIFDLLRDNPRAFSQALHLIPTEEISMLYSAFQSHLWNELLRRLIKTLVSEYKVIKGLEGDYLFWERLDEEILDYFKGLELPTAAAKMEFADKLSALIHEDILQVRSLSTVFLGPAY